MKELIQKIGLAWLLRGYKTITMKFPQFKNRSTSEIFTIIYKKNKWKSTESISGRGSELKQTGSLVKELGKLLHDLDIRSVLDIPCGDLSWMQRIDLSKIQYTGADIVEDLVEKNREQFKDKGNFEFKLIDLINAPLPKNDIIIIRDCLVHFSFADIFKALENIRSSGCTYLLTTTFPKHPANYNIATGEWRTINLQEKPFNFPPPLFVINENCAENNGKYNDKSMALWKISEV
ncbi:MAG TPA: class I SAM-dependent methyltransferase [Ferruginibacter sp.]|nr:class I SAM-dependent methyltransferase [Ferruginibacter sp.]